MALKILGDLADSWQSVDPRALSLDWLCPINVMELGGLS